MSDAQTAVVSVLTSSSPAPERGRGSPGPRGVRHAIPQPAWSFPPVAIITIVFLKLAPVQDPDGNWIEVPAIARTEQPTYEMVEARGGCSRAIVVSASPGFGGELVGVAEQDRSASR